NIPNFPPQNQCQVAVVIPQLSQSLFAHAVDVMRPSATSSDEVTNDKTTPLQAPQPLANRRGSDSNGRTDVLNRPGANPVQFVEEFDVRMFKYGFHGDLSGSADRSSTHCRKMS